MSSYGEQKISKILKENKINFKREVSFPNLRGKKKSFLRFDFGIYSAAGTLECLIEYDGEFHFKHIPGIMSKTEFLRGLENDRRKNDFCLARGIKLIRIPYHDLNSVDFNSIFNTEKYIVKTKWHNDLIK